MPGVYAWVSPFCISERCSCIIVDIEPGFVGWAYGPRDYSICLEINYVVNNITSRVGSYPTSSSGLRNTDKLFIAHDRFASAADG